MRRVLVPVLFICVPALLSAQQPARDTARPSDAATSAATATIRGRVVDAQTDQPLRDVLVSVAGGNSGLQGVTDREGRYEITGVLAGRYRLTARTEGYLPLGYGQTRPNQEGIPLVLTANQAADHIDFHLPRGGVVVGVVRDEAGDPIPGLLVRVLSPTFSNGRKTLLSIGDAPAPTDDRGEFRVFGLPPGSFYVAALPGISGPNLESSGASYAPTYFPGTANLDEAQRIAVKIGEVVSNVDLTLNAVRLGSISGVVLDAEDRPLAAPNMTIRQLRAGVLLAFFVPRPGVDGTFTINSLPPGEYEIRVSGVSAAPERTLMFASGRATVVNGDATTRLRLTATKMAAGIGRIVVAPGSATLPNSLSLEAVDMSTALPYQARAEGMLTVSAPIARVQGDGTFAVSTAPGRATLRLSSPPRGWFVKAIRMNGTDVTDSGIVFPDGGSVSGLEVELTNHPSEISGTVRGMNGEPMDDYTVVVFAREPSQRQGMTRYFATARPDTSGRYVVAGLPAGEYLAIALDWADPEASADPDFLTPLVNNSTPFTLAGEETKTLDLKLVQ